MRTKVSKKPLGGGIEAQFTTTVIEKVTFRGCPVLGPLAEKATSPISLIVALDWDCKPKEVLLVTSLEQVHDSWFEPNDKGTAAFIAFGPNPDPKRKSLVPVYACCRYTGDEYGDSPDQKVPHYWFDNPDNGDFVY